MLRRTVFAATFGVAGLAGLSGSALAASFPVPTAIDRLAALCAVTPETCLSDVRAFLKTLRGLGPADRDRYLARLVNRLAPLAPGDTALRAEFAATLELASSIAASWDIAQQIRRVAGGVSPDPAATGALQPVLSASTGSAAASGTTASGETVPRVQTRSSSMEVTDPDTRVTDTPVDLPPPFLFPPVTQGSERVEPAIVPETEYPVPFGAALLRPASLAPVLVMVEDAKTPTEDGAALISGEAFVPADTADEPSEVHDGEFAVEAAGIVTTAIAPPAPEAEAPAAAPLASDAPAAETPEEHPL